MVKTRHNNNWQRRGFALLWDPETLANIANHEEIISIRQLMKIASDWPEILPSGEGTTLVVAGFEGVLDVLNDEDAKTWLEKDIQTTVLSFQDFYEGQAGLVFWLPAGQKKISMNSATEKYYWKHRASGAEGLPIGRLLFSGAENEVVRLINAPQTSVDHDGKHWIGLHHPRIS
jgi:hypothetical protein